MYDQLVDVNSRCGDQFWGRDQAKYMFSRASFIFIPISIRIVQQNDLKYPTKADYVKTRPAFSRPLPDENVNNNI